MRSLFSLVLAISSINGCEKTMERINDKIHKMRDKNCSAITAIRSGFWMNPRGPTPFKSCIKMMSSVLTANVAVVMKQF
jgi:hypothetical protein